MVHHKPIKGIVQHFMRYAYLFSCRELEEKIDTTLFNCLTVRYEATDGSRLA